MQGTRKLKIEATHSLSKQLSLSNETYCLELEQFLDSMLKDDIGSKDVTTTAVFPEKKIVKAVIVVKEDCHLAGIDELKYFFKQQFLKKSGKFSGIKFESVFENGEKALAGTKIAILNGDVRQILSVERTVLNYLQRMSSIATITARYVKIVGKRALVLPTRKTLWGMFDKAACLSGGGGTHRLNLNDAAVVKNNHLKSCEYAFPKIMKSLAQIYDDVTFIEIEVESFGDANKIFSLYKKYLEGKDLYLMLDNMLPQQIEGVIKLAHSLNLENNILFEASGGINLKNVKDYAASGADIISVGELTHSVKAVDMSLGIVRTA